MWLDCRDVRRGSRRPAPRRCHHRHDTPGMLAAKRRNQTRSSRGPTNLLSSKGSGLATPGGHGRTATDQRSTSRRPDKPFAHRAPSATAIACRRPTASPRGGMRSNHRVPALHQTSESPRRKMRGPNPSTVHPANRMVDPGNALSGNLSFSGDGERTARAATCHGARRCRHRRVIPAGQPVHYETASIHTYPSSGRMPQTQARRRKTVINPAKRSRPAAHRPSAATAQTTPSELGGLPSK